MGQHVMLHFLFSVYFKPLFLYNIQKFDTSSHIIFYFTHMTISLYWSVTPHTKYSQILDSYEEQQYVYR